MFGGETALTRPAPARDRIVADVEHGIKDGKLPPGHALDSEAVLAARYSVSRGTVRTALVKLADRGLIESAPGSGWFVRSADESSSPVRQDRVAAITALLRDGLVTGNWGQVGARFLSEKDLCERFNLTRYGARTVLMTLEIEGLIVAQAGRGRFIAQPK